MNEGSIVVMDGATFCFDIIVNVTICESLVFLAAEQSS
jgi:hypothetical protein